MEDATAAAAGGSGYRPPVSCRDSSIWLLNDLDQLSACQQLLLPDLANVDIKSLFTPLQPVNTPGRTMGNFLGRIEKESERWSARLIL